MVFDDNEGFCQGRQSHKLINCITLKKLRPATTHTHALMTIYSDIIWNPDTNDYVRDTGSAECRRLRRKAKRAKDRQERLLASIPLIKLKMEDVPLMTREIISIHYPRYNSVTAN